MKLRTFSKVANYKAMMKKGEPIHSFETWVGCFGAHGENTGVSHRFYLRRFKFL